MRAALTQTLLKAAGRLAPEQNAVIRTAVGPDALREIESALGVQWLSMDIHMRVSDAIRSVVGPDGNVRLWTETMVDIWQRPLLHGFVEMSENIFGATPAAMFRQSQRIVPHLTRNVLTLRYEARSDREGSFVFRDYPAKRYSLICFLEGLQGALAALLVIFHVEGEVRIARYDEATGSAEYAVRWTPRKP